MADSLTFGTPSSTNGCDRIVKLHGGLDIRA